MNKPLIVMFAYYFDPELYIGAVRPWRFCTYLREMGYDCRVIAAKVPAGILPDGVTVIPDRMEEFWQKRLESQQAGTTLESLSMSAHVDRAVRRFFLPGHIGFSWSQEAAKAAARIIGKQRAVIFSTYPPIGTVFAGYLTRRATDAPWIADFRDPMSFPWRDNIFPPLARISAHVLERAAVGTCDIAIANTAAVAERWRRTRRLASRVHVIWNGFDPDLQLVATPIPKRDFRMIVHAGTLYGNRNANSLLKAVDHLLAGSGAGLPKFRIVQFGEIDHTAQADPSLHDKAAQQGWFEIRPRLPKQDAQRMMCEADCSLLLQPQSSIQVPAKLYEYISIGRPVLAVVPHDSSVELVLRRSGIPYRCLYPDDSPAVTDQKLREFLELSTTPVQPTKEYLQEFDARRQAAHLAQLIDELADSPT